MKEGANSFHSSVILNNVGVPITVEDCCLQSIFFFVLFLKDKVTNIQVHAMEKHLRYVNLKITFLLYQCSRSVVVLKVDRFVFLFWLQ